MKKFNQQNIILGVAILFLLLLCIFPFFSLFKRVLFSGPGGSFTFEYFTKVLSSGSTLTAIKNTVIVSFLCGLISTIIALPLSWLLTRTNIPYARTLRSLFCLPYAIPPYVGAIAWIVLANPSNGLLNKIFGEALFNIYSLTGLIWVMSCFFYTFILLSLLAALDRMDPSLEEAARLSGANPFKVFTQITLPIIRPALFSGLLLVVMAAAASFGVPALIGNPARIYLVTTKIYTFQKMGSFSGIYQAGALSSLLLVIAVTILFINQKIISKAAYQTVSGKSSRPSLIELGKYRNPIFIGLLILFAILFIVPICAIAYSALSKVQGVLSFSNLGLQNFVKIFTETNEAPRAFANSFKLAAGTATVATVVGLLLAYFQVKTRIKGRSIVEVIASVPYATPGTVLALAFIIAFGGQLFGMNFTLYNTLLIIGLAYLAKYLNFSLRTNADGLGQIDDCLAEAARVSGASWWVSMKTIWFPLMKPALVASWFLVFMPCFSELTMTILLTGPGLETLGTLLFDLQNYGDASGGGASVLALIIIILVASINTVVKTVSKGKYGL